MKTELICDECGHQEYEWRAFRKHLEENHDNRLTKVYGKTKFKFKKCSLCDKKVHENHMRVHVKAVHQGIKYDCDQCDFQSGYKNFLRIHIKKVHELYRHKCNLCDELFTNSVNLRNHIRFVHEGLHYICQICNRPHTHKRGLDRHLVNHHTVSSLVDMNEIQEYNCGSCLFQTTNRILIRTHVTKFHKELFYECGHKKVPWTIGKEEEKLVCPMCTTFPCPFCGFETSQGVNLQKHISEYHAVKKEKNEN